MSDCGPKVRARRRLALKLGTGVISLALAMVLVMGLASPSFAFAAAKPVITHIKSTSGPTAGGNTVTITGKHFMSGGKSMVKKVTFGTKGATKLHVRSATRIVVSAPAHAVGKVDVRVVSTSGGKSAIVAADKYTYKAMEPTVTSLDPATGSTLGGNTVTITGTGFSGATLVAFGPTDALFTVSSAGKIVATAPVGAAGIIEVTVTTAGGTSAPSSSNQYTYVAPPAVTAVSPATGPAAGGTAVTITGTGLTGATSVMFGAGAATNVTVVSATSITATAPAGTTGTVDVEVTTPFGASAPVTADQFIYTP